MIGSIRSIGFDTGCVCFGWFFVGGVWVYSVDDESSGCCLARLFDCWFLFGRWGGGL